MCSFLPIHKLAHVIAFQLDGRPPGHNNNVIESRNLWSITHHFYSEHTSEDAASDVGRVAPLTIRCRWLSENQTRLSEDQVKLNNRAYFRCLYPALHQDVSSLVESFQAFANHNVASIWRKS